MFSTLKVFDLRTLPPSQFHFRIIEIFRHRQADMGVLGDQYSSILTSDALAIRYVWDHRLVYGPTDNFN